MTIEQYEKLLEVQCDIEGTRKRINEYKRFLKLEEHKGLKIVKDCRDRLVAKTVTMAYIDEDVFLELTNIYANRVKYLEEKLEKELAKI